ncbi:hypothetical protein N9A28_03945 [Sulfurimonas sp.]|nr:hypothetical protein [Sulfurimonas sp.]
MFNFFREIKDKETKKTKLQNRLLDIRIGRQYARGEDMGGNTYECFNNTAEVVYNRSIENSDDLKDVNKSYFIEGYNAQTEALYRVVKLKLRR